MLTHRGFREAWELLEDISVENDQRETLTEAVDFKRFGRSFNERRNATATKRAVGTG